MLARMTAFDLAPQFDVKVVPVGRGAIPVMVIDGVMRDAEPLRQAAARAKFRDVGTRGGFPGLRADLPRDYVRNLLRRIDPLLRDLFFAGRSVKLGRFDCNFSLVTYPPDRLSPQQKLPHVDIADPDRIALLHYLCPPGFGGTAFYRHDASGLETVGPGDRDRWLAMRRAEVAGLPGDAGYGGDGVPGYQRIAGFDARCDRLTAYPSYALHSGVIDRPERLGADPATGRLTANFFLDYDAA